MRHFEEFKDDGVREGVHFNPFLEAGSLLVVDFAAFLLAFDEFKQSDAGAVELGVEVFLAVEVWQIWERQVLWLVDAGLHFLFLKVGVKTHLAQNWMFPQMLNSLLFGQFVRV